MELSHITSTALIFLREEINKKVEKLYKLYTSYFKQIELTNKRLHTSARSKIFNVQIFNYVIHPAIHMPAYYFIHTPV
jgi:hypothetical protein